MSLKEVILTFAFFITITLIFFYKIFFGFIPLPTDLIVGAYYPWLNYKWGNYIVGVPVQNPKLSDAVSLYYPFKSLVADSVKKGQLPLWNPYMFGGYPLFANTQVGILFPTMIFYLLFSAPVAWTIQVMFQPFLASLFMYILLRHLKIKKLPSIFGSIVYGFGGSTILWIQWNTQATTSLFLPILIFLEDKYLISRSFKWGVLLSIFICLQILAGYLPIIPFTFIGMGIWYILKSNKLFADLRILFFIILGFSLSAIFLLPVIELVRISQRIVETLNGGNPFFAPENLINLIVPDFFGNPATGNFWGRGDNMDTTIYTGITTLIFSLLGLKNFFRKTEIKFALSLFIFALLISLSNPVSVFLYKLGFWGGSSIMMNRANFLVNFSLSILGAYGIVFIEKKSKLSLNPSLWILYIVLGITTGLFISKQILLKSLNSIPLLSNYLEIPLAHINISLRNLLLPLFIIVTVLLLTVLLNKTNLLFQNKLKQFKSIAGIAFILVLIAELFRFGLKFNTFSRTDFIYPVTPISKFLEKYPNDRFVAERDIFPANMWIPFKISSIQGYDGIYPLNIAKLLAIVDSDNLDAAPKPRWGIVGNFNSNILDLTNTRFLLTVKRDSQGRASSSGTVIGTLFPKYKEVFENKGVAIFENTQSLPRVYLTKRVIKAPDKDTLKLLTDENFPIKTTAITDDFEFNNNSSEALKAELTYNSLTNSLIQITATSNMDAYLVILDSFYPGWKALIDGKETTIHRTNYNFRGVVLPKGTHIVEFIYDPKSLKYGAMISGISFMIIIILLIFPRFYRRNIKSNI